MVDGFADPNLLGKRMVGGTLVATKGRVESFSIDFQHSDFGELEAALVARYGEPDKTLDLVVKRGRRYLTAQELSWKGQRIDIDAVERLADAEFTRITFRLAGDRPPS